METMRYQENRKSYKGVIIGFFLFVIIGGALIYIGIKEEKEPVVIGGNNKNETQSLVDTEKVNSNIEVASILVDIKDKVINDNENKKLIGKMTIPEVYVSSNALDEINNKIYSNYFDRFSNLKESMGNAENKFTFEVTYKSYDNVISANRIISLSLHQAIIDDSSKKTTNESITTYNIDIAKKEEVKLNDVLLLYYGTDYKTITRNKIKEYLVQNKMIKEDEYTYALTGLENFYVKDSQVHIVFNSEEIVNSKYGILDITI